MQGNRTQQKSVWSWAMYDWANSAFATTIMASVLPAYYSRVAAGNLAPATASSYWGYTNTIAMLTVAMLSPVLGAIADYKQAKMKFLAVFACVGCVARPDNRPRPAMKLFVGLKETPPSVDTWTFPVVPVFDIRTPAQTI